MVDILICDRNASFVHTLETFLKVEGYWVHCTAIRSSVMQSLRVHDFGVAIVGVSEADPATQEIIGLIHSIDQDLAVVAIGEKASLELERSVRMEKVFYYMVQPVGFDELREVLHRAVAGRRNGAVL